jgi:hypothetical protein
MSVDFSDIKPVWKNYFRKNIALKKNRLCLNDKRIRGHLLRTTRALKNERDRDDWYFNQNEQFDERQRVRFGISEFEQENKLLEFCGDYPFNRRWWRTFVDDVDALTGSKLWSPDYYEDEVDEDWYTKKPEEFNKTIKLLSPWATRRHYGQVFFSTETRYISKDKIVPPAVKQQVQGYYKIDHIKIPVPFIPKPRSDIYHPPKTGITTYGSPKYKYRHTGNGILKVHNFQGSRYHFLSERIHTIEQELQPFSETEHTQESVVAVLFAELRDHHFDLEHWANDFTKNIQTRQEVRLSEREYLRAANHRIRRKFVNKKVRSLICKKVIHSNLIRRIQRVWRRADRRTSVFGTVATFIERAWRNYVFRGLGTRRTIIGQLSKPAV